MHCQGPRRMVMVTHLRGRSAATSFRPAYAAAEFSSTAPSFELCARVIRRVSSMLPDSAGRSSTTPATASQRRTGDIAASNGKNIVSKHCCTCFIRSVCKGMCKAQAAPTSLLGVNNCREFKLNNPVRSEPKVSEGATLIQTSGSPRASSTYPDTRWSTAISSSTQCLYTCGAMAAARHVDASSVRRNMPSSSVPVRSARSSDAYPSLCLCLLRSC
jgi:radical SAM protein with 4Fe4S-binding SPASM domain